MDSEISLRSTDIPEHSNFTDLSHDKNKMINEEVNKNANKVKKVSLAMLVTDFDLTNQYRCIPCFMLFFRTPLKFLKDYVLYVVSHFEDFHDILQKNTKLTKK